MTFTADLTGDVFVGEAVEGQKDHPCSLGDGLRTGAGTDHRLEDGLLPFRDDELACPPWHCSDSRCLFEKVGGLKDRRKAVPIVEDRFSRDVLDRFEIAGSARQAAGVADHAS